MTRRPCESVQKGAGCVFLSGCSLAIETTGYIPFQSLRRPLPPEIHALTILSLFPLNKRDYISPYTHRRTALES
ncbi:hypothetical protein L6452_06142 [Arctium lappa]|uniref:Uncharacterized protein n=1 Tax=Arctium lappa TaxID=4217 RepID=A0ACB9EIL8_ARCLA|nr:hypothetical protein L6452_06142 [Arctium lappa]